MKKFYKVEVLRQSIPAWLVQSKNKIMKSFLYLIKLLHKFFF